VSPARLRTSGIPRGVTGPGKSNRARSLKLSSVGIREWPIEVAAPSRHVSPAECVSGFHLGLAGRELAANRLAITVKPPAAVRVDELHDTMSTRKWRALGLPSGISSPPGASTQGPMVVASCQPKSAQALLGHSSIRSHWTLTAICSRASMMLQNWRNRSAVC